LGVKISEFHLKVERGYCEFFTKGSVKVSVVENFHLEPRLAPRVLAFHLLRPLATPLVWNILCDRAFEHENRFFCLFF
jgi:hypothetical protein